MVGEGGLNSRSRWFIWPKGVVYVTLDVTISTIINNKQDITILW